MGVIAILMLLVPRVSLRLPWAMNRLAFQAASGEVRRRKTKVKIARNEFIEPTLKQ